MLFSARHYLTNLLGLLADKAKNRERQRTIYRLSSGSVDASDAVKEHNANMRFATREAAARHRAHPLDVSRIVPMKVSAEEYRRLFKRRHSHVADLRQLPTLKATRLRVR
jgi:hypothetical protein